MEYFERESKQHDVIVSGVPVNSLDAGKQLSDVEVFLLICEKLNVCISAHMITKCYRIKKKNSFLVKLCSSHLKESIMRTYFKNKKRLVISDVYTNTQVTSRIYLNENLTSYQFSILRHCQDLKSSVKIAATFSRFGKVFVTTLDSQVKKINSISEVDLLIS